MKDLKNLRALALEDATKAHAGQKRKDGQDYVTHLIAVAEIAEKLWRRIAHRYTSDPAVLERIADEIYVTSVLHDTEEDTDLEPEYIDKTYGTQIESNVYTLSRSEGQSYYHFIKGIVYTGLLVVHIVKVADLEHNMSDLKEGSMKDKYRFAHHMLLESLRNIKLYDEK